MTGFSKTAVLVTGGAGFIGSHTVVELLQENQTVIVVDNLSNTASLENSIPPALSKIKTVVTPNQAKKLHFVKGSYGDKAVLDKVFKSYNISAVIHFGGFKAVGESKELPLMYYRNNVAEALKLIKAMNEHNVKNIIFSSSATVYSEVPPEELPLTEDSPLGNCTCPYASTKLFIENILRDVALADNKWKVMALRYFNPVGAHESGKIGEDPKGVPNNLMPFIAQVAVGRRKQLSVFGSNYPTVDGTGVRDYVHVVDVAKGHTAALHALEKMHSGFRAYNLGSGKGTSVMEMVDIFREVSEQEIPTVIKDRRAGDVAIFYCDPSRAWDELGWKTEKTVRDMCSDLWNFQQKNPNGYLPNVSKT